MPVETTFPAAKRSEWSDVSFPAVRTTALRVSVQCEEGWSAGICHWKVPSPDAASLTIDPPARRPDLFLGDLSPVDAVVGWDRFHANFYSRGEVLNGLGVYVGGAPCTQYLWAHPASRVEFIIPSGYTRLTATCVGPSSVTTGRSLKKNGSWSYQVQIDGSTVFQSKALDTYASREVPVDVKIPAGARRLTLITDPMGSPNSDHAFWALPMLHNDTPPPQGQ